MKTRSNLGIILGFVCFLGLFFYLLNPLLNRINRTPLLESPTINNISSFWDNYCLKNNLLKDTPIYFYGTRIHMDVTGDAKLKRFNMQALISMRENNYKKYNFFYSKKDNQIYVRSNDSNKSNKEIINNRMPLNLYKLLKNIESININHLTKYLPKADYYVMDVSPASNSSTWDNKATINRDRNNYRILIFKNNEIYELDKNEAVPYDKTIVLIMASMVKVSDNSYQSSGNSILLIMPIQN